jgi:hypothetical protein
VGLFDRPARGQGFDTGPMSAHAASSLATRRVTLRWPVPALLAWLLAWGLWVAAQALALPPAAAFSLATAAGLASALFIAGPWRRVLVAIGFPLSASIGGAAVPAWGWLLALLPLVLAYPLRAWSDAPFFPTPRQALDGLDNTVVLTPGARVLDAGCGLGHGLAALGRVWPQATLHGIEWSRPLAWLARWRCRGAQVQRGDMWALSWAGFDAVYLFQRPESMARAYAKARAEMAPGAWLLSLEFAVPDQVPLARLAGPARRAVWIYRLGVPASTQPPSRR